MKKTVLSAFVLLTIGSQLLQAKVDTKYDKFKDETKYSIPWTRIAGTVLDISAFYLVSTKNPKPSTVALMLVSKTDDWQYLKSHSLVLIADGERIDLGNLKRTGTVETGHVIEHMWAPVPIETFKKIANAQKVEGQLFTTEFVFAKDVMSQLKELADSFPK